MIRRILARLRASGRASPPLPRPEIPVCLIGDIHGRHDLLSRLFAAIAARPGGDRARVVVLGDMIDRGPDSARVLGDLAAMERAKAGRLTCLMGNHERMMLDFLAAPEANRVWLRHGGMATLAAFGVARSDDPARLAADLRAALSPTLLGWIAARPLFWHKGDLAAVHAGADPRLPIDRQMEETLLWGHADFGRRTRRDGVWVVHGHVVSETAPWMGRGTIGVDTGAWSRGVLSAAWFDTGGLDILTARAAAPQSE